MKKINVAVAGFPNKLAMSVAEAVCQSSDMKLFGNGLSESDFANRHLKIACTYMDMYNGDRMSLFFQQDLPDVLVDCFSSNNGERDKLFTGSKIPLIVVGLELTVEEILESIRELSKVTV